MRRADCGDEDAFCIEAGGGGVGEEGAGDTFGVATNRRRGDMNEVVEGRHFGEFFSYRWRFGNGISDWAGLQLEWD